jgi:hypothetical protein
MIAAGQAVNVNLHMYMAPVDTGASSTCISPGVVVDLGLQPVGKFPVSGAHAVPTNVYVLHVVHGPNDFCW